MQTIAVTGGCGYVGSKVAVSLAARGHRVVVTDIVSPESRGITFPRGVEFRHADLRRPEETLQALRGANLVLHMAADIGSLTYMHEHQADIMTNNAGIDAALYPAMVANGVSWVVYSSSSMVFENAPKFPYTEADLAATRLPTNLYGFSKLSGEYFCRAFRGQHGLRYTIIRYHNIYGPGEDAKGEGGGNTHVIPALIQKVKSGQYPLEFLGDPSATRPFTYVDDAVEATVRIVELGLAGDHKVEDEDFNIGNDTSHTILELGKLIWQKFGDGREFKYVVKNTDAKTALRREVDMTKIKTVIGWQPRTALETGLELTEAGMRESL
jgi:UDP-glucose 4-epimerase